MAKPNYEYAKRQRDIAKKQKKEAKRKLKAEAKQQLIPSEDSPEVPVGEANQD
ncbi:MAG: hypothetical protein OEX11_05120 [Nitrosomonas sp.]|nr:hypothetical protein [Nitrosomonas sp.]